MTGFRPFMARLLARPKEPVILDKKVVHELDPRPVSCDCGRPPEDLIPDGHSWVCPCGLRY